MQMHENSKEKIPGHLVDFCEHSSANWMAAGSRAPSLVMEFFSFLQLFNTPYLTSLYRL